MFMKIGIERLHKYTQSVPKVYEALKVVCKVSVHSQKLFREWLC